MSILCHVTAGDVMCILCHVTAGDVMCILCHVTAGDLRVMVSQGSKGGFHAKVDIVDAPNSNSLTAAGPTAAANMVVAVPTDQELHEHFSGLLLSTQAKT